MPLVELPDIRVEQPRTIRWGILILPSFPMLSYSAVVEPLRAANTVTGQTLYEWVTVSATGRISKASSGLGVIADYVAENAPPVDRIVVVSGVDAHEFVSNTALGWIRRELRRGAAVGAVSDGAFFLARAGLLDGYVCTLHWRVQASFREAFPNIDCTGDLYVLDRDRFSAAGGISALDMMLAMIEQDHGRGLALAVSEWYVHSRLRHGDEEESLSVGLRTNVKDARVRDAISLMAQTIEEPRPAHEIAATLHTSVDTLERAFRRELGQSTMQYYRMLRFRRAQDLLRGSTLRVSEIAVACGFSDSSSFARAYRAYFGSSPRQFRKAAVKKS